MASLLPVSDQGDFALIPERVTSFLFDAIGVRPHSMMNEGQDDNIYVSMDSSYHSYEVLTDKNNVLKEVKYL
ncbi:hypothetical protein [Megasphaera sp.]|uniref:hypothetical protein n=1 Tax=Megasphaera TaxID=906 RepID=UPI0025C725DF|nr:hypothetical protein [Megasphaera sp.]